MRKIDIEALVPFFKALSDKAKTNGRFLAVIRDGKLMWYDQIKKEIVTNNEMVEALYDQFIAVGFLQELVGKYQEIAEKRWLEGDDDGFIYYTRMVNVINEIIDCWEEDHVKHN